MGEDMEAQYGRWPDLPDCGERPARPVGVGGSDGALRPSPAGVSPSAAQAVPPEPPSPLDNTKPLEQANPERPTPHDLPPGPDSGRRSWWAQPPRPRRTLRQRIAPEAVPPTDALHDGTIPPVVARPKPARNVLTGRHSLRSRLRNAVEGAPPTWAMRLQKVADGVEETRARAVIDLAMRIAEALLTTGSSAADVTATVLQLTRAYGLRSVHIDVTYTSITVSHHRGALEDPVTIMRIVSGRISDFDRLQRLQQLVADLAEDPLPVEEARARFVAIMKRPHPYRRGLLTAANAGLAAAIAALLDGSPLEIMLTLVTAVAIDKTLTWVSAKGLAPFFGQIIGGAIPTAAAVGLMYARATDLPGFADVSPSIIVTAGIVVLLAGMQLVGAAQDAIDGFYVTATGRTFEVVLLTLGIVVGILSVLGLGQQFGMPAYIAPSTAFVPSIPIQMGLAAVVSAAFAIVTYSSPRTVLVSLGTGAIGWAFYLAASLGGFGVVPSSALGAFAVGALSQSLGRVCRVPALAITTAGIVTLLPGGMVYRGLYGYMTGSDDGLATLMSAGTIGLALAAGVSLGTYVARPMGEARTSRTHRGALRRALKQRGRQAS